MKKTLTLIVLVLVALSGMAQGTPKNDKIMKALISDAISRGMREDGTYTLDNRKNKYIEPSSAKTYLNAKGYIITNSSTKDYMRFGNPIKIVDKITFFDPKDYHLFAFCRLKGNNNIQYSQLNKSGTFIYNLIENLQYYRGYDLGKKIGKDIYLCKDVLWSGPLVNGLLDGHGVGFLPYGNGWCYFEGDFKFGFPISGLNMKTIQKDDWRIKETHPNETGWYAFTREKVANLSATWKNPPAELHTAILEYAKYYYEEDAKQIERDFNNLLPINKDIHHKYSESTSEYFVNLYNPLNYDPKSVLAKAKEMRDLKTVRRAMAIDLHKKYMSNTIIFGLQFDMTEALKDTALMGHAIRIASSKKLIEKQSPFRDYYRQVLDVLYDRSDDMYDNINNQIHEYNDKLIKNQQYEAEMCEKCKIVGSETVLPSGYVEENTSWFFGHPAQSEDNGKIVLVTGDVIVWKYIYPGSNQDKTTIKADWSLFWSGKEFESEKELMDAIVKKCKNLWCH